MGESESPEPSEQTVRISPLVSVDMSGNPYKRRADIEALASQLLARPMEEWLRAARKTNGRLPSEALVILIRSISRSAKNTLGALVDELSRRITGTARRLAGGFDAAVTKEILTEVQDQLIERLFASKPTRQSEFLEIAFSRAVQNLTINVVEKYRNQPPLVVVDDADPEQGEDKKYIADSIPETRPGPDEILLGLEDRTKRSILIGKALESVKDRRHVEAVILHYVRGWPIVGHDPTNPSLERHFGKSGRQIQNWIKSALETMRDAIGDYEK